MCFVADALSYVFFKVAVVGIVLGEFALDIRKIHGQQLRWVLHYINFMLKLSYIALLIVSLLLTLSIAMQLEVVEEDAFQPSDLVLQ